MNKEYDRQEFDGLFDRPGKIHSDMVFKYCRFISCFISATKNPRKRSIIRNMAFYGCETRGCSIYPAIIEDVLVSSLKTHNLLQTWGAVFKHVKLEGNLGNIMISPLVDVMNTNSRMQTTFDEANVKYYATVDWALDISEGRFIECDIRRVPAHLIRRDPETQIVVTRAKALLGEWKELDLSKTYWRGWIELFLKEGDPDVVLVAPKRHPKFDDWLDGLKKLRDAGVAEPD